MSFANIHIVAPRRPSHGGLEPRSPKSQLRTLPVRAVTSVHRDGSDARNVPAVEISVTVIPIVPKLPTDAIHVGMDRTTLRADFAQRDVMISSREDECFLETYIYLGNTVKETVIRLINGRVASVSYQENEAIRTITPSS